MQGTGRRGAPSLFVTLPRTGLYTEPYSGPRARLCSGPHGSHLLPHTVIAAPPLAPLPCRPHHCCSLRAVRIFVRRPSPACHIPDHAVPRACRCPAAFLRPSGVRFAHVTQQMYAHLLNMLKINILQSRRKRQSPDRKQVAFFRFPGRTARRYRSVICTMLFFAYIGGRLSLTPYLHEKTCTQNALCRSHRAHGIAPLLPEG